jgi:hypothetical protein
MLSISLKLDKATKISEFYSEISKVNSTKTYCEKIRWIGALFGA